MAYPFEERLFGHILTDQAKKLRDKPFCHFKDHAFTYGQVEKKANQMAAAYQSLGIKKGDCVVAMLPNTPEFIFHWFGLAKLGAIDAPINTAYKGELLKHVINICDARVMLIHEQFLERLALIQDDLVSLEKIVVFCPSGEAPQSDLKFEMITLEELIRDKDFADVSADGLKPSDPLMIIYTSGTTGPSKGAVLPHQALYYYACDIIDCLGFTQDDIIYSNLPLYHINIRFFTIMASLLVGGSFVLAERFSASRFWDEINQYKATAFCFPGAAMINYIYNQPPKKDDADNSVRIAWMGPISGDMAQKFEKRFNLKVYLGYFGMTEANYITSLDIAEMDNLKKQGKWDQAVGMGKENKDRYEVKLVDENDNEVPTGQSGEIICRPARPFSMMLEYINMPEKTLEAFRNLWFHTGDMARKDEEGHFYFVDRKKDYLRCKGENISSFEVESAIISHPAVAEVAVIAVKYRDLEEEIKAIIRLKEGQDFSYEDLMAWCEERMAYFMVPRFIQLTTRELPKTPTGRIQKYKLRELEETGEVWDRVKAGYKLKR